MKSERREEKDKRLRLRVEFEGQWKAIAIAIHLLNYPAQFVPGEVYL
jgi:hypothetical protein